MATGLAIDSSDMDVLVSGVGSSLVKMARLHQQMKKNGWIVSNTFIETASVPVIKIVRIKGNKKMRIGG